MLKEHQLYISLLYDLSDTRLKSFNDILIFYVGTRDTHDPRKDLWTVKMKHVGQESVERLKLCRIDV